MSKTAHLPRSTRWPESVSIDGWEKSSTPQFSRSFLNKSDTTYLEDVVKWPHPETQFYLNSLDKIDTLSQWDVPIGKDTTLYRHIMRLKYTLEWWDQIPTSKHLNSKGIIYQNLLCGPSFADELDDAIKYGLRLRASLALNYGKEEYPEFCNDYEDQDQLFSPRHLIPFERPETDDIKLLLQENGTCTKEFEDELRELINEYVHTPIEDKRYLDDVDKVRFTGSSTSFDSELNKRIPKIQAELKNVSMPLTKQFIYDYVNVYKAPHESRACVVPTKETLHTISLLELQMEQVISCPWDAIREKDFSYLPEYLSIYSKNLYIMSDQKKCGLTFPRKLLIILYEELEKQFPTFDFSYAKALSDSWIKIDGQMYQMQGGPGLGQFNKSISLLVSLIFESWRRKQDQNIHLKGKFYNDDQVIKFTFLEPRVEPLPDWVQNLALDWDIYMESFGLNIHKKKPFVAASGIFLEVYGDGFPVTSTKITQKVGNIFHTLCSANICEAKELFSSIYNNLEYEHQIMAKNLLLNLIVPLWGFEFYPQEVYLPYQFGGWVNFRTEEGLDDLFNCIALIPERFMGLMNLPFIQNKAEGSSPNKTINSHIKKLKTMIRESEVFVLPSIDYNTMVSTALSSFREKTKQKFNRLKRWKRRRLEAFNTRPISIKSFTNKYWELTFEQGKAYAPPQFAAVGTVNVPFGEKITEGKKPDVNTDPIRIISRLRQEIHGSFQYNTFWTPYKTNNINSLLYLLIHSLNLSNFVITPKTITYAMILGTERLEKIFNYSNRVYGMINIPDPPFDILNILGISSTNQINNIIYVNHNSQFVCITNWNDSFLPDKGQIEKDVIEQINNYLFNKVDDYIAIATLSSITDLEENLPSQCRTIDISMPNIHPVNRGPQTSVEDQQALAYILYQIAAPEHQVAVELELRNNLAYQIEGIPDDAEDVFSDEEGLLDMFG